MVTTLYCTLADVRSELNANSTVDDKKVMRGVRQLSRRIDSIFRSSGAFFAPTIETRDIALDPLNINSANRTLILRSTSGTLSYLLDFTSLTINNQTLTIGTNVQAYPPRVSPVPQLQLIGDCARSWYSYLSCGGGAWGPQFGTVTGVWGYNTDYSHAWLGVDTLSAAILNTTATTFTVANVDGDNPYAESPRISAGNLIQIDTEWMDVVATDIVTDTVTVIRGVNGSTAATHVLGAVVSVYLVPEDIRRICRQAAFQYARIGAFDIVRQSDFSTVQFPEDLLTEIRNLLNQYANE